MACHCLGHVLWRLLFCGSRVQVEAFKSAGFLHRKSLQYHWRNRDRKTDGSNNGAGIATGPDSTVTLEAMPMTPSEEAQRMANTAREEDGCSSIKYVDFDSYLGNFASKRRIKVGVVARRRMGQVGGLSFLMNVGRWATRLVFPVRGAEGCFGHEKHLRAETENSAYSVILQR